jgi:hypothetical protein
MTWDVLDFTGALGTSWKFLGWIGVLIF